MKYRFKTKPYAHQVKALKKLLKNGWGGALLMEPRTGKTKVAIDFAALRHLEGKCTHVVIICPVSVIGVWKREIEAHCPCKYKVIFWDRDGRRATPTLTKSKKRLTFLLVNYDAFSTPGKRAKKKATGRYKVKYQIDKWSPDLIILDESHRIKNPSAKKTRTIQGLKAPYRIIMSGTAVTKKKRVFDIFAQWKFLNPERFADLNTFRKFKNHYGVWNDYQGFPRWIGNKNLKDLHARIHADSYAIARSECFDLPEQSHQVIPIQLEESWPLYVDMAQEMIARLKSGEVTEASIKLVQMLRLAQITSGMVKTTPTPEHPKARLVRVGREKLRVLSDLLADLFEKEEKVVLAARFIGDIAAVVRIAREASVPHYLMYGGTTRAEREEAIERFRKLPGPSIFIMQPNTGALGIDLSTASVMIWLSLTTSFVDFSQANDRIALSHRPCTFYYLLAEGTVDEVMFEALRQDKSLVDAITASPERLLRNEVSLEH